MPVLAGLRRAGRRFALATIVAAEGGPRPPGTQMVLTEARGWGCLSGGCLEADLACHARAALADGRPRRFVYGRGSPWIDVRLACGARLEVLLEVVDPPDPALAALLDLAARRRVLRYVSDGRRRLCGPADAAPHGDWPAEVLLAPRQRLVVVGTDPFATAIAQAGAQMGWEVRQVPILMTLHAIAEWEPDPWTAVAVATHDSERDHAALSTALRSRAGYVGVLGSRARIGARRQALRDANRALSGRPARTLSGRQVPGRVRSAGTDPRRLGRGEVPSGAPVRPVGRIA